MLPAISTFLPPVLRSPRSLAIVGLGIATVASVSWYRRNREEPDEEELERERREYLAATGRIVDGSITETRWANDAADADAVPSAVAALLRIHCKIRLPGSLM